MHRGRSMRLRWTDARWRDGLGCTVCLPSFADGPPWECGGKLARRALCEVSREEGEERAEEEEAEWERWDRVRLLSMWALARHISRYPRFLALAHTLIHNADIACSHSQVPLAPAATPIQCHGPGPPLSSAEGPRAAAEEAAANASSARDAPTHDRHQPGHSLIWQVLHRPSLELASCCPPSARPPISARLFLFVVAADRPRTCHACEFPGWHAVTIVLWPVGRECSRPATES